MARGETLQQLISDLRDELRRVNAAYAGPADVDSLRRTINHTYRLLYLNHDWSHLHTRFARMTLNAGQRYYDPPDGLDFDRITDAVVWWSGEPQPLERGISFEDYDSYDPEADERTSPALKWDVRFTGVREQIEVWPLPDSAAQYLQFDGIYAVNRLVDNIDICRLDGDLIVLYAAAELLPNDSPDKKAKQLQAQEMLRLLKIRGTSGAGKEHRLGVGESTTDPARFSRAVVRVR